MTTTTTKKKTATGLTQQELKRLATLARRIFLPGVKSPERRRRADARLLELLEAAAVELPAGDRDTLRRLARGQSTRRPARSPPEILELLARTLGTAGLHLWAVERHPRRLRALGERATLAAWLRRPPFRLDDELLEAGIRYGVERTEVRSDDIDKRLGREFRKEGAMATATTVDFKVDPRNFPDFDEQDFVDRVKDALPGTFDPGSDKKAVEAAIVGILLVDGHANSRDFALKRAVRTAIREAEDTTIDATGASVSNTDIYKRVAAVLTKGPRDNDVYYEELVAAARSVFQNAGRLAYDEEGTVAAQIDKAAEEYATGGGVVGGLDLPELVTADDEDEVVSENVRAVSVIYAAYQLEQARVFDVVDRIMEIFMNGLLPVGFDAAGRALDDLYFSSEDRYDKSQRFMQYSRVLGAPGGDVSSEVAPNGEFERLFLRFLASVSEFERQSRLGDLFDNASGGRRSLAITGEHVRKAGRDLAANTSLYGWANTHFAARRLSNHVNTAMKILRLAEIQNSYGVQSPWQVIERVSSLEFGEAPNIVRHRTLADSGKKVLDIVANNATAWTSSTSGPLFDNVPCQSSGGGSITSRSSRGGRQPVSMAAIKPCDRDELFRHTEAVLAVMGIKDIQIDEYSEPGESVLAPSIPTFGPAPAASGGNGGGNGNLEAEIRRMVETGQQPSLDDLKRLAGIGS